YRVANTCSQDVRASAGTDLSIGTRMKSVIIADPNQKMPPSTCSHCTTIRTHNTAAGILKQVAHEPDEGLDPGVVLLDRQVLVGRVDGRVGLRDAAHHQRRAERLLE